MGLLQNPGFFEDAVTDHFTFTSIKFKIIRLVSLVLVCDLTTLTNVYLTPQSFSVIFFYYFHAICF